jgi:REP element-mobilizing transposase RayT
MYHCISRVVDRRFVLEDDEREQFRKLMRMCEKFSGCRVLSYCIMSNHFHLLLEVPPMPAGGIPDAELFERLGAFYSEAQLAEIAREMADAVVVRPRGEFEMPRVDAAGLPIRTEQEVELARLDAGKRLDEIRSRFTRRMHDLSEFMKSLLERFTKWFNSKHERSGHLWEDRFKSVIVEDGVAARTIAAYIDLNPVRAGMVADPAEYRWSSYGEAIGGGTKGNGKKSREGLVRACLAHEGVGFEAERWKDASRIYRRLMGMALGKNKGRAAVEGRGVVTKNTAEMLESEDNETVLPDLGMAVMLLCRIRYFTDGAVIGSRAFVNGAFEGARERFGARRKDGARPMRGNAKAANEHLWSIRDLRLSINHPAAEPCHNLPTDDHSPVHSCKNSTG